MARPKKYNISLTDDELKKLKSIMRKKQQQKLFGIDAREKLISLYPVIASAIS